MINKTVTNATLATIAHALSNVTNHYPRHHEFVLSHTCAPDALADSDMTENIRGEVLRFFANCSDAEMMLEFLSLVAFGGQDGSPLHKAICDATLDCVLTTYDAMNVNCYNAKVFMSIFDTSWIPKRSTSFSAAMAYNAGSLMDAKAHADRTLNKLLDAKLNKAKPEQIADISAQADLAECAVYVIRAFSAVITCSVTRTRYAAPEAINAIIKAATTIGHSSRDSLLACRANTLRKHFTQDTLLTLIGLYVAPQLG